MSSQNSQVESCIRTNLPHISICLCTFRRPILLAQLLYKLSHQLTKDLFSFSIVVVDNDDNESARNVVTEFTKQAACAVSYRLEPRQNIAVARNTSVDSVFSDFIAFIDDDEEPSETWLYTMYEALIKYKADGVLGPVVPKFEEGTPKWALKSKVFYRPEFKTGAIIHWSITGTGNVLLKREVLQELDGPFNPTLGAGGEDTDLFRRSMALGRVFVWCAEAVCFETVPLERTRLSFQLRRALLRGKIAVRGHRINWLSIVKSTVAVPLYVVALPFCLIIGTHIFATYLVRTCDHLGKLLAICGIDIAGEKYVTEQG